MHQQLKLCAITAVVLTAVAWAVVADSNKGPVEDKKEQSITIPDLPAAVRATIDKEIPGANIKKVDKEEAHGKVTYDVEAEVKGEDVELDIAADGKLLTREDSVEFASLPAAVRAAAEKYFGATTDLEAGKEVEDGKTFYEVEGKKAGHKVTLKFAEDGKQIEEEKD